MKRGMSKLLSILLIATLVFTSASVAFAGTEEGQAVGGTAASVKNAAAVQPAKIGDRAAQIKTALERKNLTWFEISNESDFDRFGNGIVDGEVIYTADDKVGDYPGYAKAINLPAKGVLIMRGRAMLDSVTGAYFGLYKDSALRNKVDTDSYSSPTDTASKTTIIQVPAAGTYYLGVHSTYKNFAGYAGITVEAGYINGGDKTISNKQKVLVGQKSAQANYFKFNAKNTGYLSVVNAADEYDKVTLCNSKKKALSNSVYAKYATFGVKKGTYWIKVDSDYNSKGNYTFQVNYTKIKEKSGTKRAKAVSLKKNKTVKGTITAGSKQTDWYKFKLKKDSKIKSLTLKGGTNGKIEAKIYNSKGKAVSAKTASISYNGYRYSLYTSGKIKKGTYYIKVYNANKKHSGYYTLSWK